jgi:hypothetical protein
MRGLFCIVAGFITSVALTTMALGQPECEIIIADLNRTSKTPASFDVGRFLVRFGLEYTTCPIKNGQVYCFKCLYNGAVSAVEIAITDNGSQVSPPQYGCSCQRGR